MSLPVFNFDDFSYEDCQTFIESLCVRESEKQRLVYLSSPLYKGEGNWHSSFQSDHRINTLIQNVGLLIIQKSWYLWTN